MRVGVRLFAAAREAVGEAEVAVELPPDATIADALDAVDPAGSASAVLARCSILVDGAAEPDRDARLGDGTTLDVLPPFAGG